MKLADKASGLLRGLRRKQQGQQGEETQSQHNNNIYQVLKPGQVLKERSAGNAQQTQTQRPAARATANPSILGQRSRDTMGHNPITIHQDNDPLTDQLRRSAKMSAQEQIRLVPQADLSADESVDDDSGSESEADESVLEDMRKLEENFKGISRRYRLINRIGEGTFSTVYKAEQLSQSDSHDVENTPPDDITQDAPPSKRRRLATPPTQSSSRRQQKRPQFVALKKIYVTSSPHRILNELELLHELRDSPYICPLLTAFRHLDQVVAVLPYFRHLDFRLYYRDFLVNDMRHYFRSLFNALAHVHRAGILHRDIKPTNFLYDHAKRQGVLVDFGLAEKQGTDCQPCLCQEHKDRRKDRFLSSFAVEVLQNQPDCISTAYPKNDTRPSRRANRAGTRGFRAPEVLLKCTAQTTKIDIWSAGVILLTLLARRFPFFNSADDVDAMIEMASIFGRKKMQGVAAMHGQLFETNIETIGEKGFSLEKIVIWASCREKENDALRAGENQAVNFLQGLLELDPYRRVSAKEALSHEFFTSPIEDEEERAEREAQEQAEDEERKAHQ